MQRIGEVLRIDADLQSFAHEAQQLAGLTQVIRRVLPPPLRPAVKAGRYRAGILNLIALTGAAAAKLKQLAPRVQSACLEAGWQVTEVRVGVQVDVRAVAARSPRPQLGRSAAQALDGLADRVTDAELSAALRRLARR